ncbi:hypothetical protein CROQUDRAFT_43050, partial [Cronartium quercuum f. sp. fusiforme G11]
GHEVIDLNEKADEAAKRAAGEDENRLNLLIALGGLLLHTKRLFQKRRAGSVSAFHTKSAMIADGLDKLEKGQVSAMFQLRYGHNDLRKYLFRIRAELSEQCESCNAVETRAHFLVYCRRYSKQSRELIKVNRNSAIAILDNPKT